MNTTRPERMALTTLGFPPASGRMVHTAWPLRTRFPIGTTDSRSPSIGGVCGDHGVMHRDLPVELACRFVLRMRNELGAEPDAFLGGFGEAQALEADHNTDGDTE